MPLPVLVTQGFGSWALRLLFFLPILEFSLAQSVDNPFLALVHFLLSKLPFVVSIEMMASCWAHRCGNFEEINRHHCHFYFSLSGLIKKLTIQLFPWCKGGGIHHFVSRLHIHLICSHCFMVVSTSHLLAWSRKHTWISIDADDRWKWLTFNVPLLADGMLRNRTGCHLLDGRAGSEWPYTTLGHIQPPWVFIPQSDKSLKAGRSPQGGWGGKSVKR